jgi:hypothetical protein
MFEPASLKAAVAQTIAAATVPDHHGFAAIVDLNGAHVALATRTSDGWSIYLTGGYEWHGPTPGADAQFTIGKSW